MHEPPLPDRGSAIFFDFDGTLTDIAPRPDAVRVDPAVPALLSRLSQALGGAVALVSGRPVAEIDQWLQPLVLPAAGVHGVERRAADGVLRRLELPDLDGAQALIEDLCRRHPALRMERKSGAIALHYRQSPSLEAACLDTMTEAVRRTDGTTLLRGKMVLELKPAGAGKGLAVQSFLGEPPFEQRRPWFFGDDVTDEAAFDVMRSMGGVAVKIGDGDTLATYRMADPAALRRWMARAVEHLDAATAAALASPREA